MQATVFEDAERQRKLMAALEPRSEPMRQVLMTTLMPHLTAGLLQCCAHRPEDAVAFMEKWLREKSAENKDARKFIRFGRPNSRRDVKARHSERMATKQKSVGTRASFSSRRKSQDFVKTPEGSRPSSARSMRSLTKESVPALNTSGMKAEE